MRVYELAKELGISSKDCIARLAELGVEAGSHMSTVEDDAVAKLKSGSGAEAAEPAAKPAPAEKKAAKKEEAPTDAPAPATAAAADAKPAEPEKPVTPEPAPKKQPPVKPAPASEAPAAAGTASGKKEIKIKGPVVVREFAETLGVRPNVLITELMKRNILASITQKIEPGVAAEIAEQHGFELVLEKRSAEHKGPAPKVVQDEPEPEDRPEDLVDRPPIVTFLGHVDHGKTSLLDKIRSARVAAGESGGITQHIGAYTVDNNGRSITFLDTPGHAAFTSMRARGANLTDIAVIIIAADDGIMPQTREAIQHAQAANVALMIAINKIDLPNADAQKAMQQLQQEGLTPEEWGGDLICAPVSAMSGEGIDDLLEMILLQSEILELKANPKKRATGYVIEAQLEPGRGATTHALVTTGTLKVGDFILCGEHCGKVRALMNDRGESVKSAGPSTPVKVLGLSGVPDAGAEFRVYKNERAAKAIAAEKMQKLKTEQLAPPPKTSLDSLFSELEESSKIELKIVLKADTQGSIEAIQHALGEINSDKVALNFILSATGNITENDIMLASASDAVVLGFHVGKEPAVNAACKREGVDIRLHQVIYELIDEVREAMTGLLAPQYKESVNGKAEILQVFPMGKTAKVAGCRVVKGSVRAKDRVRVRRKEDVLYEGRIESLKHFQDSVAEVREAQECGIRLDNFSAFEEGDTLEFYAVEEVVQTL